MIKTRKAKKSNRGLYIQDTNIVIIFTCNYYIFFVYDIYKKLFFIYNIIKGKLT